ncbi:hypothetical protein GGI17_003425 [Coemansia sp. S146]|nr:hypothetical protein GGI17_003425 [Coemansia sp. S146]
MQRGPYSRETTDISDQELRQILESENISGLPAPYCLAPHYDGQGTLPQNSLWSAPAASPSLAQRAAENALASSHQQQHQHYHQSVGHESNSSQSSPGGHDGGNLGGGVDGALAATAAAAENSAAPRTPLPVATGETSRRRTRTTLTPYQLRVLFRVWERTQYPSSDLRFRLATNLMMTPRNVQIWFQNQRQKTKERAEMRRRTHSPSIHSTVLANMGATQIPHHHPAHGPSQHSPVHLLEFHTHDGHMGAISMPGRSPPESPFRYTHGPPPAPPAIPPPTSDQRPYYSPSLHGGDVLASEKGSEAGYSQHILPHTPLPSDAAQYLIPSPSTPTFAAEQLAQQQSPSPLTPRRRLPSPPLSSSMHSLSMAPVSGPSGLSSQTLREHPASRRARLVDILNPITSAVASSEASGMKGTSDNRDQQRDTGSQLGPLPSLGVVLANVQSAEDTSSEAPFDAASSTSTSTAAVDKWRPW